MKKISNIIWKVNKKLNNKIDERIILNKKKKKANKKKENNPLFLAVQKCYRIQKQNLQIKILFSDRIFTFDK